MTKEEIFGVIIIAATFVPWSIIALVAIRMIWKRSNEKEDE